MALAVAGGLACAVLAAVIAWPMDTTAYVRLCPSGELLDRNGQMLYAYLNDDEQWCFERKLGDVSPRLIEATLAAEDKRFRRHPGVDVWAVVRAVRQNLRHGGVVSGASTLTMQVVKQKTLRDGASSEKSLGGKCVEAVQALRLDARLDKDTILETYLNTAPYGLNLVGCEAASRRFFGKSAKELTLPEAALLAGLPKAPTTLMPLRHKEEALQRRNYVLARMLEEGYITQAEFERAEKAPLGGAWHDFPADAPHVAMRLREEAGLKGKLTTALDKNIQETAQRCATEAVRGYHGEIGNAAVVVLDVPSGAELAHVGSANFFETPGGGQVDACRAPRSPGSALKPFTYAVAMEHNRLYACERLLDRTLDYGLYSPENMDGAFYGLISARDALRNSLNVPAVTVLERVGIEAVYSFLQQAGFTTLVRPAEYYGLGLTLGGCEVRLDELAAAYCMVAALGGDSHRLSAGTCLKLYEMLEQPLPGGLGVQRVSATVEEPRVCWKTGTSTGYRDAWAVVFNAQYVVAVWMGNNDGRPSSRLIGIRSALPLAADVFRSLPRRTEAEWPAPGNELRPVEVCAVSGLPSTPWCTHTKQELLPRTQYLNRRCDVHYPLMNRDRNHLLARGHGPASEGVDLDQRKNGYCPYFLGVAERWPGRAKGWDLADIGSPAPASFREDEEREKKQRLEALRILVPTADAEYVLTGETQGDRIKLQASVDEEGALFWYVDDAYLGTSEPRRPLLLDLKPGTHRVACMSADGMLDSLTFKVVRPDKTIALK